MVSRGARALVSRAFSRSDGSLSERAALMAAAQYLSIGLSFGINLVAARVLGPRGYGIAALLMGFPALVLSLLTVDSGKITTRYVARLRAGEPREFLSICKLGYVIDLLVTAVGAVIVAATASAMAHVYDVPHLAWLMVLYGTSFIFASPAPTSQAIFLGMERFRLLALSQLLDRAVKFALVGVFLALGWGIRGFVLGMALGQITGLVNLSLATRLLSREVGSWWTTPLAGLRSLRREAMSLLGWNYLAASVSGVLVQAPLVLLGAARGPEEAGFYRAVTTLGGATGPIETAPATVVYPRLSSLPASTDARQLRDVLRRWTLLGGLPLGFLVAVAGVVAVPLIVPVMFGNRFSEAIDGARILFAGAAVTTTLFWLRPLYYSAGHVRAWAQASLLHGGAVLLLTWPIAVLSGFIGLVALVSVGRAAFAFGMLLMTRRIQVVDLLTPATAVES